MTLAPELLEILVCPQCKGELEYRTSPESLVCHTCRLVYPVEDGKLFAIDVSNPTTLSILGHVDLTSYAGTVHIVGTRAYVASVYDGVAVVDITTPTNLVLLGTYNTPTSASDVQIVGTLTYIADTHGLHIVDLSDPAHPVGGHTIAIEASGLEVVGNRVYVASGLAGLTILDATDPAQPTILGTLDTPGGANRVRVVNDVAFILKDRGRRDAQTLFVVDDK